MKKTFIIIFLSVVVAGMAVEKKRSFTLQADIQGFFPLDEGYKKIYASLEPGLDFRLSWRFLWNLQLWAGAGIAAAWGRVPEFDVPARSQQYFFQGGIGWKQKLFRRFYVGLSVGAAWILYSEQAMEASESDQTPGIQGGIEFQWELKPRWFLSFRGDIIYGSDQRGTRDFLLGGVRCGMGLGWIF